MKILGAFFLLGFAALGSEMTSASVVLAPVKPGLCPAASIECLMVNPPNKCDYDFECKGKDKCCPGKCGRECVSPVLVKVLGPPTEIPQ